MITYHPMARYKDGEGELFVTDGELSLERAVRAFTYWEQHYRLTEAWVDVYVNGEKKSTISYRKSWIPDCPIQVPYPEFIGLTYRTVLSEIYPSQVGEQFGGGACGCPSDHEVIFGRSKDCDLCKRVKAGCNSTQCWSQIYGRPGEIGE